MSSLSRTRRLLLFASIVLLVPLMAACTGDDDDDDNGADSATDSTPVATSAVDDTEETATPEVESTPDTAETPEDDADETGTTDTASTPDTDSTSEATTEATGTMESTPDAAGTPDDAETPDMGTGDDPFGDLAELSTDVPNFTLDFTGMFDNAPDDTGETFTADTELMMEQSEEDVYHLSLITTGDDELELEVWSLPDATFVAESGSEPVELPAGTASQMSLADALMIIPPVEALEAAEEVGQEDIDGRAATHYQVDAEDAALVLLTQGVTVTNPEGDMDIWVDDELDIVVQMTADLTFENEDGSDGSIEMEYMVTEIDDTSDIEAPS